MVNQVSDSRGPADGPWLRMVRVARALEEQLGSYAGRIWWAAAFSLLVERSLASELPADAQDVVAEMEAALQELRAAGAGERRLRPLERTKRLVAAGERVLWSEFGRVDVCRHCGQMSFGEPPEVCPNCRARPITRREFPPIWFLEPLAPAEVHSALEASPRLLRGCLEGLAEESLRSRSERDEWSAREVIEHLWLAQQIMQSRIQRMLEEEDPTFEGVTIATAEAEGRTTWDLIDHFQNRRVDLLEELAAGEPSCWQRGGWHDEFGEINVLTQASYMARHEHYHLRQLDQIRESVVG